MNQDEEQTRNYLFFVKHLSVGSRLPEELLMAFKAMYSL